MEYKDFIDIISFFHDDKIIIHPGDVRKTINSLADYCSTLTKVDIKGYLSKIGREKPSELHRLSDMIWECSCYISENREKISQDYAYGKIKDEVFFARNDVLIMADEVITDGGLEIGSGKEWQHHYSGIRYFDTEDDEPRDDYYSDNEEDSIGDDAQLFNAEMGMDWEDSYNLSPSEMDALGIPYIDNPLNASMKKRIKEKIVTIDSALEMSEKIIKLFIDRIKMPDNDAFMLTKALHCAIGYELFGDVSPESFIFGIFLMDRELVGKVKNKSAWIHILLLLSEDGPCFFKKGGWFKKALSFWNLENDSNKRIGELFGKPTESLILKAKYVIEECTGVTPENYDKYVEERCDKRKRNRENKGY